MIVRDFLICLLQMYLLEDLEKNMLPYRRENFLGKFLVYFVIALVMLGINHLESSIFNMVMIPVTYMIVSMVVFRGNIWKKLVIVCCYYVLAIIPEFLFATLTNAYGVTGASEGFGTEIEKTLALLLMSTMTFLFIKCINQVTRKRDYLTIENKTFTVLLMLPTATIIILGCVFYSNISFEGMNRVMVPVGASLLLLTNIFIFSVFDRFVEKSEEVKKMARLYQKSRAEIANLQYMNSGIIGMVPVTFIVNTNVDRNDIDHPLHLYHRIELTFSTGRLCLVNTHGPVIWLPFLHMPRDEYGTLSINVEEEVNIPSGVTIGNVMLPSVKETFEQIWPDAVKKALEILFKQNRTEKMSMAQYQIYVSKLWSEICQKVGYMNIVDYDNFGDIKSIFYDLEKRHLIKKENDGIE